MSDGTLEPYQPKHRRDGVPLDGAPDLGLFTTHSPVVSSPAVVSSAVVEPVASSNWSSQPGQYVAPSSVPPEYPAAPTVSEFRHPSAPAFPAFDNLADFPLGPDPAVPAGSDPAVPSGHDDAVFPPAPDAEQLGDSPSTPLEG